MEFMDADRFPDRPQHPDFWRMSEVVLKLDGESIEGHKSLPEQCEGRVDVQSLEYLLEQRVGMLLQAMHVNPSPRVKTLLMTVGLTSFVTGLEFERAGGHQPKSS